MLVLMHPGVDAEEACNLAAELLKGLDSCLALRSWPPPRWLFDASGDYDVLAVVPAGEKPPGDVRAVLVLPRARR